MKAPQIIMLIVIFIDLLLAILTHGKRLKLNFWYKLIDILLYLALLYWGGFFG